MKIISILSILGIILFISSCDQVPDACFTVNKTTIKVNDTVQFSAACSKNATSYQWNFGDGILASGQVVKHQFLSAGALTVVLSASNSSKSKTSIQLLKITN